MSDYKAIVTTYQTRDNRTGEMARYYATFWSIDDIPTIDFMQKEATNLAICKNLILLDNTFFIINVIRLTKEEYEAFNPNCRNSKLEKPLRETNLPIPVQVRLINAGYQTLGDLYRADPKQLRQIRGMGKVAMRDVKTLLEQEGLKGLNEE